MYNGWLEYAGVEILNVARTRKYVENFLPRLNVVCPVTGLQAARGHANYVSPAADNAPWYKASRPATGRFYGLFPGELEGADDSSRTATVIELAGAGAVHGKPRYGSREVKMTALALAGDDEAMSEGLAWLKDALSSGECATTAGCSDNEMRMYSNLPTDGLLDNHMLRSFIRVEVLDNVKVVKEYNTGTGLTGIVVAKRITVIFSVGSPWAFTQKAAAGNVVLSTGATFTDPVGEDCYSTVNAYADFINDPFYTAVAKPPQPPKVLPPNVIPVSSWRRKTLPVTQSEVDMWGRVTPVVTISTGVNGANQVRIRFYGDANAGCSFEGEFLVSYIPPNATMVIDSMRQQVKVVLSNGRTVPGGHLVYGSGGLPPKWPALGCRNAYTMTADMLPGQTGITVYLETAVRE